MCKVCIGFCNPWIVLCKVAIDTFTTNYGFFAQSKVCPLSTLHKVWIKPAIFYFVLL